MKDSFKKLLTTPRQLPILADSAYFSYVPASVFSSDLDAVEYPLIFLLLRKFITLNWKLAYESSSVFSPSVRALLTSGVIANSDLDYWLFYKAQANANPGVRRVRDVLYHIIIRFASFNANLRDTV